MCSWFWPQWKDCLREEQYQAVGPAPGLGSISSWRDGTNITWQRLRRIWMREVGEKADFTKPPPLTFLVLETRSMILPSFKLMFPVGGNISRHTFYLFICIHFATFKQSEKRATEDKMVGSMDMSLSKLREIVKDREARHTAVCGVTKSRRWLSNWTTTTKQSETRNLPTLSTLGLSLKQEPSHLRSPLISLNCNVKRRS